MFWVPKAGKSLKFLMLGAAVVFLSACGTSSLTDIQSSGSSLTDVQSSSQALGSGATAQPIKISADPASPVVADTEAKRKLRAVATEVTAKNTAGSKGYKIGPQDVLQISVFKVPDLSKSVQVSEVGTINYPLIGEITASGKTAREMEIGLTETLGAKYLQNPQVSVLVSQYNSQRVTIEGAVKKPGIYPLQGGLTLLQLVATAGGLGDTADDQVVILRTSGAKQKAARFSISELRGGDGKDPNLEPGDVIIAHTSITKQAFNGVLQALPLARVFMLF